ncbi:fars-3 [Pristionchus pacificus]|nr:fars-3 [Pristionchus pacificus]
MPTVGIQKPDLDKHLERVYNQEQFEELCFDYGLELDDITSEKQSAEKEKGVAAGEKLSDVEVYKVDIPANRYDLLCVEGLSRAIKIFQGRMEQPDYKIVPPASGKLERIVVKPQTKGVRPFVVGAILRDVTIDDRSYASFIDLQDKLHQNICRKRSLVAIGTHDLDTVKGPFIYNAEKPSEFKFIPLNESKEFTAEQLMVHYSGESHLKPYLPILAGQSHYPVIRDANGIVCSMPPIINGDHSKITLKTKNIFIEATATDLQKAIVVLDTMVTMYSQYCKKPFTVEPVEVEYEEDGRVESYPKLSYRERTVKVSEVNTKMGFSLEGEEMASLLVKMSLKAKALDQHTLHVVIPPTRHDILHECDIVEDVGVAYGFNKLELRLPSAHTVATPLPLNSVSDHLRIGLSNAGFTEALNFALCSKDDSSTRLRRPLENAVIISNPKTLEFQMARTSLLPGLLRTVQANSHMPLPLKLFELQDVILADSTHEVGARNERRVGAIVYAKQAGFEMVHGLLDRLMILMDVKMSKDRSGYYIQAEDDPAFLPGRCASIIAPGGKKIGHLGCLHPEVITSFSLSLPTAAIELTIEPFV